jgi:hypothetical protein
VYSGNVNVSLGHGSLRVRPLDKGCLLAKTLIRRGRNEDCRMWRARLNLHEGTNDTTHGRFH